ncbi:hypothetical protein MMC06_006053 [Schaereria dolodes]|nr:hypothetical protein [Schaereria dolodes]
MIAIHTILYIIKPNTSFGEAGLYNYRYLVYICWITYPVLMASLAFLNPRGAYISQGTFCYLPVRPFWYRLALSWIPRYIILLTITGMYLAINLYVRHKFKNFDAGSDANYTGRTDTPRATRQVLDSENLPLSNTFGPATVNGTFHRPKLSKHSLTESFEGTSSQSPDTRHNFSNTAPILEDAIRPQRPLKCSCLSNPAWESYTFGDIQPLPKITLGDEDNDENEVRDTVDKIKVKRIPTTTFALPNRMPVEANSTGTRMYQSLHKSRNPSVVPPRPRSTSATTPVSNPTIFKLSSITTDGTVDAFPAVAPPSSGMTLQQRHVLIKRQLRFLFVYPLVYTFMWTVPFAAHCLQYSDYYSQNPPFVLNCFTTPLLALQCAVDCWLFGSRERPWRNVGRDGRGQGTFWKSLKWWEERGSGTKGLVKGNGRAGRRVGTMMGEAEVARVRRALEVETERLRRREDGNGEVEKNWWEVDERWLRDSDGNEVGEQEGTGTGTKTETGTRTFDGWKEDDVKSESDEDESGPVDEAGISHRGRISMRAGWEAGELGAARGMEEKDLSRVNGPWRLQ